MKVFWGGWLCSTIIRPPGKNLSRENVFGKNAFGGKSFGGNVLGGNLRVLGPPNPGQSFRRGQSGPQATEVTMDPGGTWAAKTSLKFSKKPRGRWILPLLGTVSVWVPGSAVPLGLSKNVCRKKNSLFVKIAKRSRVRWILPLSGTVRAEPFRRAERPYTP